MEEATATTRAGGAVIVRYAASSWSLTPGDELTIGRSSACRLHLPDDHYLSRRAGLLRVLEDCVIVFNESTSKPLVLRPPWGEDRVVEPGAATTSLGFSRFTMVFTGHAGATVEIHVDTSALAPPIRLAEGATTRAPDTVTNPIELTAAQHRILVTLCEPLLTRTGAEAAPASYTEIARRLDLRPQYVRNVIKNIRECLAGYGVPGLTPDDPAAPHGDFRWSLARWALRSGWITRADVTAAETNPGAG